MHTELASTHQLLQLSGRLTGVTWQLTMPQLSGFVHCNSLIEKRWTPAWRDNTFALIVSDSHA